MKLASLHSLRRRGFTLIEILISVTLMSLILTGAYVCFDAGIRTEKMVDARTDVFQNARVAMAMISADLRNACPINEDMPFVGMARSIGDAEAGNLDFATHNYTPRRPHEGDFCEVSYYLDKDRETGQLCLWRRRNPLLAIKPLSGGRREVLVRGVAGLRFEYFDGLEWFNKWGDADGSEKSSKPTNKSNNQTEKKADLELQEGLPESVRITLWLDMGNASKKPGETNEPPMAFQTIARLNLAAASRDQLRSSGGGSSGDANSGSANSPSDNTSPGGRN